MRYAATGSVVLSLTVQLLGQSSLEDIRFEVTSVKPNRSGELALSNRFAPTSVSYGNTSLRVLITYAYEVTPDKVVGGPEWINRDRFDVTGTMPPGTSSATRRVMMQRLLEARFRLAVERQTRVMPVYRLEKVYSDGRLGPGLRESRLDCSLTVPDGQPPTCRAAVRATAIDARGYDWAVLGLGLLLGAERPVVDHTGLKGRFDVSLEWTPVPADAGATGVSVFTALREQLGLRLEPAQEPIEVLAVLSAEQPSAD